MSSNIRVTAVFIVLLISLLSISTVSAAGASDDGVYVSVNGSDDSGDGSSDNPYLTVKKAINNSQNGSTIYLSGGNYSNIDNTNLTINKFLTISALGNDVIFNGGNNSYFFNIAQGTNLNLIGIDFYRANTLNSYLIAPILNYGTLNIVNCSFVDNLGLRSGVLLNYGTSNVYNSNFINNQGNYTGVINNLGIFNIYNSTFENNRVTDKNYNFNIATNGSAVYNLGNLSIYSSNFLKNGVFSVNNDVNPSLTHISYSSFLDNSMLYIQNSTGFVTSSYFENLINVTKKGELDINYSVILNYDFTNATVTADYNWWGHNEKIPPSFVDKWLILTFTSNNNNSIPGRTNAPVKVSFKLKDSQGIHDIPVNEVLPKCFVRLIADNGNFTNPMGYLIDNSFSSNYYNNTVDTVIYANVADYYLKLKVGTGLSNQKIYVSNSGSDDNNGSYNSPLKSLSKAIDISLNGATIYISSGSYTGDFNSNLLIAKNLTFTSFNGPVIFLRGNNTIFKVAGHGQLDLNDITFTASNPNIFFPIINSSGALFINNCTIKNLRGGDKYDTLSNPYRIYYHQNQSIIFTSGYLSINNTVFTDLSEFVIKSVNFLDSQDYIPVNITISNSIFKNLSGIPRQSGGSVYGPYHAFSLYLDADFIKFDNCTFIDNAATPIKTHTRFSTVINNSLFINNEGVMGNCNADDSVEEDYGNNTIMNSRFVDNKSPRRDYWTAGYTSPLVEGVQNFINCTFENNKIVIINTWYNRADNITIYGCYFINNTNSLGSQSMADHKIEGIILNGGNLTIEYSIFNNNDAYYGGAIANDNGGTFYINHSVFINNVANLGKDIVNKNGYGYISNCWWGSNSGPTGDKVFTSIGETYIKNWVIMTLKTNGTSVTASLDKVTDQDGNIYDIDGILPSREVVFTGKSVSSPLKMNLYDNKASFDIQNQDDLDVSATIDNQTVNLTVRSRDTIIDINNTMFYGKNNAYNFILRNINGYLISNQTVRFIIRNQTGIVENYTLVTDENGKGQILINNSIGDYTIEVLYPGDGYFNPSSANATMKVLPYYTDIFVAQNRTFYGKNNIFYMTLYDNNGKPIPGETIKFIVTGNGKNITYNSETDDSGQASFLLNLTKGSYTVKIIFEGDDWHIPCNFTTNFEVAPIGSILELLVDHVYGRGNAFPIKLTDSNGNVLKGETITFTISQGNKTSSYNLVTNDYGIAGLMINLSPGTYNVTAKFAGDNLNLGNTTKGTLLIDKAGTRLSGDSVFVFDSKNSIFKVKLTDIYDRPLSGEFVNITISNLDYEKTYRVLTDNEGIASLTINTPEGNYLVMTNFPGTAWYGNTFAGNTLIVDNIDPGKATKISFKNDAGVFIITLTDANGKAISNRTITLNLVQEGLNLTLLGKTDSKGLVKFSPALDTVDYNIFYSFLGDNSYYGSSGFTQLKIAPNSVSTALNISNVSMRYGDKKNLNIKLTDKHGKLLIGKTLSITVKGNGFSKVYYFTTNSAGMISVPINLAIGKYTVKASYTGEGIYKSSTASGTINVDKQDKTTPKISKVDPANNKVINVANKALVITFSENIKAGSAFSSIKVTNPDGVKVNPLYKVINGKTLTLTRNGYYINGLTYTITLPTGSITDTAGNAITTFTSKFKIDFVKPTVTSVDPANNRVINVANKALVITFSEAIKAGSAFTSIKVTNPDGVAVKPLYKVINGKTLTLTRNGYYINGLTYTITLPAGSITDTAGNTLATAFTSKFIVDFVKPTITSINPTNTATKVARNKAIKVTFNENIKASSSYWIELVDSKGKSVKITKSISGKVLTINHAKLVANTKYKLIIHTGAVTDKAGNPVAVKTYTFTTGKT
ncbi:MAG: Ig-like domain-containing protein [Methanobacteriaceae archaeon]|nr:Ig-like domain-containing protein [Methanobacteriaceae archaeon]